MSMHSGVVVSDSLKEENSCDVPLAGSTPWHAIRVRPRWERVVASALRGKQIEEFLPVYRKRSRWSDRVKEMELPLFPGYVFCRADLSGGPTLVTTPGVIGILKFGSTLAIVSDSEIQALQAVLRSGVPASPWPYLAIGQTVRIDCGALAGIEGILLQTKNDCRVVLSVEVLCRSVAVEVDRDRVTPLPRPTQDPLQDARPRVYAAERSCLPGRFRRRWPVTGHPDVA